MESFAHQGADLAEAAIIAAIQAPAIEELEQASWRSCLFVSMLEQTYVHAACMFICIHVVTICYLLRFYQRAR